VSKNITARKEKGIDLDAVVAYLRTLPPKE